MRVTLIVFLLVSMICSPLASASAREAIAVWGVDIVPSLFPYMVLCQSLSSSLRTKKWIPPEAAVVLLGILGGSPSGSAVLQEYAVRNTLSKKKVYVLSVLTGTISPMFFIGPLERWIGISGAGILLLASNLAGATCAAVIIACIYKGERLNFEGRSCAVKDSRGPIERSVLSVLNVGGCIVFFSAAAGCLHWLFPARYAWGHAVMHALMEIAGGLKALCQIEFEENVRLSLCAAATGFGGCSILCQNLCFLAPLGIGIRTLLKFSFLRAVFSTLALMLLVSMKALL